MKHRYSYLAALLLLIIPSMFSFAQDATEAALQAREEITAGNVNQIDTLAVISPENTLQNSVFEVAFDPTSKLLAYITLNEIGLWSVETQTILWRIPAHQGTNVAFSPDGVLLVASNYPETYLWRNLYDSGSWEELVRENTGGPGDVGDIQFSEDGQEVIAVIRQNYGIYRWQANTGELLFEDFQAAGDERSMVDDAILSSDGQIAAIFGRSGSNVEFIDTANGSVLSTIAIDDHFSTRTEASLSLTFLSFTPDNQHVLAAVSASDLPTSPVLILSLDGEITEEIQYDYDASWTAGAFNRDGTLLGLANAADGAIYFFDSTINEQLAQFQSEQGGITSFSFSADSTLFASGSYDGTIRLWGVPAGGE